MTDSRYTLPAEWHRQACVQLTWPHAGTDWAPYLDDITETFVQIAKAVARYEPLVVATRDAELTREQLAASLNDEEMARVSIYTCDNDDTWARDHAFLTLLPADGTEGAPRLADFRFNGWGDKFEAAKDNALNRRLLDLGAVGGDYVPALDFVLEGGSIESDGHGTILTTSQCLLAPHRNQPLTRDEIERRLMAELGADRVLWLDHGNLLGDDTDGHVDTIVRFAPGDTLLYIAPSLPGDGQQADFTALEAQLRTLRTADGRPYRLLPLPMSRPIFDGDDRLPATYANFLVINGAVIVPTYDQPDLDNEALTTIATAFPGRDIVGIDARTIIRQHGSIHCLTMQYPEGVTLNRKQSIKNKA